MDDQIYARAAANYETLFLEMTPDSLELFDRVFTQDVQFRDPFNDVHGIEAIRNIFEHMYKVCESPRFEILSSTREDNVLWLYWNFDFRVRQRDGQITGASMVKFSEEGKVSMHIDFWDAASQIYEHIPFIGWFIKKLRQAFATPQTLTHGKY